MKIIDKNITHMGKDLIEPFNPDFVTPNGYDLSIKEVEIDDHVVEFGKEDIAIPAKTFFRVMTREKIKMPSDMIGELWLRSTYARKGIQATFGLVDAGFMGTLALSLYNASKKPFVIGKDEKPTVCQIVFEKLSEVPERTYAKRSGNYQNQETLKK